MSARVLVCDDEAGMRFVLRELLEERGHVVLEAQNGEEALTRLDSVDVVLTDLAMPGMDGHALLRAVRASRPEVPVIVLTAHGTERDAVSAMKNGAFDYFTKPFDVDEIAFGVARAVEAAELRAAARRTRAFDASGVSMLGESPPMRALVARIERIAPRDVTVLVRGETGTGKELVASLLHALSKRARGPLVRFNCAALATELAESELFGHVRGAFTGATEARTGYFARAHGGTLVLDEVGELPLAMQAKLLRAAQDGEIQPVGAAKPTRVDVRIVAVTHRDLAAMVAAGTFREDLYYRLSVVDVDVPPLRERASDVPILARAFAAKFAHRFDVEGVVLTQELLDALSAMPWRGNVRELENTVARIVAGSEGGPIGHDALPVASTPPSDSDSPQGFRARVDAYERSLIADALTGSGGNRAEAARRLGLSRVTLLDRMKRLGVG